MWPTEPSTDGRPGTRRSAADRLAIYLDAALDTAVATGSTDALEAVVELPAADERDELIALLAIHDLSMSPLWTTGGRERFAGHPAVAALKWRLEGALVERLEARASAFEVGVDDPVAAVRRIAAADLVPAVYGWLADDADWDQLVAFLTLEGGPDAGFDDLVALAQVGLHGGPKVTMGANYWDEMGCGDTTAVHTSLHDRLVAAIGMPRLPREELPASALERCATGGLLATNHALQPEALGAFGLIELQAGPRCRAVVRALRRLDAPADAFPFYEEHAEADPRHGKEWLDHVIAPLCGEHPSWGVRIVQGALWRHEANRRFFADAHERCAPEHAPLVARISGRLDLVGR